MPAFLGFLFRRGTRLCANALPRTQVTAIVPAPMAHHFVSMARLSTLAAEYTAECKFGGPEPAIPVFRLLAPKATEPDASQASEIEINDAAISACEASKLWTRDWCRKVHSTMLVLSVLDSIMQDAQRQGRISFYMTSLGEEAASVASAAGLEPDDVVFAQYRELGALMYRGFTLDEVMHQCFGTSRDPGLGRQMPMHFGAPRINVHTISSPLATQLPQAVGAAYALGLDEATTRGDRVVVMCYFGEGAASEGDFHAALNMAATLRARVIFFCRNNQYAISTHSREQYAGDGIAARAKGYGIPCLRVDGNDALAVHQAVRAARNMALTQKDPRGASGSDAVGGPVLVEAMTYRAGHHSTSDDASAYRPRDENKQWQSGTTAPIARLRAYMVARGYWSDPDETAAAVAEARREVLAALARAESEPLPAPRLLFDHVWAGELPGALAAQRSELLQSIARRPGLYPLERYAQSGDTSSSSSSSSSTSS